MLRVVYLVVLTQFVSAATVCAAEPGAAAGQRPHRPLAKMHAVGLADVRWTEGFWAERWELCRREMLPSIERALLDEANSEQLINLKIAAGLTPGAFRGTDWSDGDCYKWLEALALMFATTRDPELDRQLDEWIGIIARAQAGRLLVHQHDAAAASAICPTAAGLRRHVPRDVQHGAPAHGGLHSLSGHGQGQLSPPRAKTGDHLHRVFQPGAAEMAVTSGNLPVIMGLVDLYRTTGDRRYLETAQAIIDARGTTPGGSDLTQDHVPLRQETEAVGHAVFATYLYCGATDVYAETGEQALGDALQRIWTSAALRRTYITGGALRDSQRQIGPRRRRSRGVRRGLPTAQPHGLQRDLCQCGQRHVELAIAGADG